MDQEFQKFCVWKDDVEEDDVEMTVEGGVSSVGVPADEDTFEKQIRHNHESTTEQLRVSTTPRYVNRLSGHAHVNQTYPDVVRMWRQFHGCPASGGGIERVFFSARKQHDALKKNTMDKTLEITLKASINTMLPTCDDKGVFTDDDDTYRKRK